MFKGFSFLRWFLYGLGLFLLVWQSAQSLITTYSALVVTQVILGKGLFLPLAEEIETTDALVQNCETVWLQGRLAEHLGNHTKADQSWHRLLSCSSSYIPAMMVLRPHALELAEQATRIHPESASAWFWLADAYRTPGDWPTPLMPENYELLVSAYYTGLQFDPIDNVRWRELGDVLSTRDLSQAMIAYSKACFYGDSGANSCWRAGQAAEQLGDLAGALYYYDLSVLPNAQQRAAELRRELNLP